MPFIEPFGVTPLGLFFPTTVDYNASGPPGILADAIDYGETDQAKPGRRPTFEKLSLTRGIHPIDEQVLTALTLVKNSGAAVQNDGNEFATVRKITSQAKSVLESLAKNALKRLVANADIEILSVKVVLGSDDSAELTANFRNLRSTDRRKIRTVGVALQ